VHELEMPLKKFLLRARQVVVTIVGNAKEDFVFTKVVCKKASLGFLGKHHRQVVGEMDRK
jgi:hypothetical protein